MKKKLFYYLIIGFTTLSCFNSCKKDNVEPAQDLNFDMDCNKDSSYFYYATNNHRIYLDLCTQRVTIKFSGKETNNYIDSLVKKNSDLNSISYMREATNIAYGYVKAGVSCEKIRNLLVALNKEDRILCANPSFYTPGAIASGIPVDDSYNIMGLTDEFTVRLKDGIPESTLDSLLSKTKTKLIKKTTLFFVISATKYSERNSLEMSRYFYETGYFEYSNPDFLIKVMLF